MGATFINLFVCLLLLLLLLLLFRLNLRAIKGDQSEKVFFTTCILYIVF